MRERFSSFDLKWYSRCYIYKVVFAMFVVHIASLFVLLITLLPLTLHTHWSVRVFDFPRVQIIVITLFLLAFHLMQDVIYVDAVSATTAVMMGVLVCVLTYQVAWVFRYTPLSRTEVKKTKNYLPQRSLRILAVNVLQTNTHYSALLKHIEQYCPDVVVTLETDEKWEKALAGIEKLYPYTVKIPQDNLYGMHLFSQHPLQNTEAQCRIRQDIPSITTDVMLTMGGRLRPVKMYFLHPMPPSPTESPTSLSRDQELILVAKEIAEYNAPCVVAGDLNDVAWSKTTRLFRKLSGLLDPRIGRGFFNTFHAGIPLLRWPLDHIFHSHHFTLNTIKRLGSIDSDHFPIFIDLQLQENESEKSTKKQDTELDEHEEALLEQRMENVDSVD
jgi:endonuclease/exonuclease/phosphatase (EEP) superfamily protein YafD